MWGYPGYPMYMMPPPGQQYPQDPYQELIKKALKQAMRRPKADKKEPPKKKLKEKTFSWAELILIVHALSLPVAWLACHIGIWLLSDIGKITAPFVR